MPDHIASELRRAFEQASMRREAEFLKTPDRWAEANAIRTRSQRLHETEERLFRDRYDTRVEAARRRIVDEAASRPRHLTPAWAGSDRFDPVQTLQQADRDVRQAHERRLTRIAASETKALDGLLARARQDRTTPGQSSGTEASPTRRRSGPDR